MQNLTEDKALLQWCEALLVEGKYDQAKRFARILHQDDSFESLKLMIKTIEHSEGTRAALDTLEKTFIKKTDFSDERICKMLIMKAELLTKLNQLHPALQSLKTVEGLASKRSKLPEKLQLKYKLASLHARMRNFEAAQAIFNENIDIPCSEKMNLRSSTSILQFSSSSDQLNSKKERSQSNAYKVIIDQYDRKAIECVYFVAGDLKSCKQFGKNIAQQLEYLTSGNVHFHIHGVITEKDDPGNSENAWALLEKTLQQSSVSMTFSYENLGLDGLSNDERNAITSSERFRHLTRLLKHYKRPIIVSALDILPIHTPTKLLSNNFDVALMTNSDDVLDIIKTTPSQLAVFNATVEAIEFADKLENYLNNAITTPMALQPKIADACLIIAQYMNVNCRINLLTEDIIQTGISNRAPYDVYKTGASFIGRALGESPLEFSRFLQKHYTDLNIILLARAIGLSGEYNISQNLLDDYLKSNPKIRKVELFEIFQTKGLIHAHANELERSQACLQEAQETLPRGKAFDRARSLGAYQLGSVSAAIGDIDAAQAIFNKQIEIDCDNGWMTNTGIVDFNISPHETTLVKLEHWDEFSTSDDIKCVYMVCANLDYCRNFAPALIKKFTQLESTDIHLHIHGVALNEADEGNHPKDWKQIRALLDESGLPTSFSLSNLHLTGLTLQQRKSIYASERFRLLPNLFEKFKTPIIIADIDQLPLKDMTPILDNQFDAQLLHLPKSVLNFLSVISATLSIFYPTKGGYALAHRLKAYFDEAYANPDKLSWHIDQAALAVMKSDPRTSKIGYIDNHTVEKNPRKTSPAEALEKGAYFWSVTNSMEGNLNAFWCL